MAEPSILRRSGRKRQANRKYSLDLIEELQSLGSDSDNNEKVENPADAIEEDDDEFKIVQGHDIEYTEDPDGAPDDSGNVSPTAEDNIEDVHSEVEAEDVHSEAENSHSEVEAEDVNSEVDANELPPLIINERGSEALDHWTPKEKNLRYQMRGKQKPKDIVRSRGLIELSSKNPSKEGMLKFMAGGHPRDWVDFLRTKDRWLTDPTLPTKLDSKRGKEGMCHHFSHTKEKREMEATIGWDWYYDHGGRELFAKRQRKQVLTPDEGLGYIPKAAEDSHQFLMGPYGNQQLFRLETGHSMYLDDAWKSTHETIQGSTQPGEVRDGWTLNLGTSIKCLDWATNQDGDIQYLAVVTAQPKPTLFQPLSEVSPAYTPSAPLRSCIQIWEFPLGIDPPDHKTLPKGPRKPPALQLVICTEWGEIKQLKWCQVPRTFRDNDFAADKIPLGLLSGVWSDGLVRVLDVSLDKNSGATASHVKYDEPAFEAWAPNTLCTCVTWLSASMIAVGFANGFLAIWDISQENPCSTSPSPSTSSPSPDAHPPRPWLYTSLHQTYILALTSAYPLSPHLLSTSSVDGFTRLTDLRSPTTEFTLTSRSRNTSPLLSFSPHTLSILSTEENDFARLFPLRSFHSSIVFARTTASPLCLAANHFHPCVLIGCADGSLLATNPLPRVWNRKWKYYQQVVFRHEWMRGRGGNESGGGDGGGGRSEEGGNNATTTTTPQTKPTETTKETRDSGEIIRITESYKITPTEKQKQNKKQKQQQPKKQKLKPSRPSHPSSSPSQAPSQAAAAAAVAPHPSLPPSLPPAPPAPPPPPQPVLTTIYPEENGITQVSWNPNLRWGGWMAAGMGSGGVRVMDLGV